MIATTPRNRSLKSSFSVSYQAYELDGVGNSPMKSCATLRKHYTTLAHITLHNR